MAHLDEHYDVLLLGTGLVQSILAGSLASVGRKVLHLDRNTFYGSTCSSFTARELDAWLRQRQEQGPAAAPRLPVSELQHHWPRPADMPEAVYQASRRFSLDLCPKLIASRGSTVDLLITSGTCIHLEFRAVSTAYMLDPDAGKLLPVPSTKSDVFTSDFLDLVEKRSLMRFLKYCLEVEAEPEAAAELADWADKPFLTFLQQRWRLNPKLCDFLIYVIAMQPTLASDVLTTQQGFAALQYYLRGVGRFGRSPFLYSMYGSSEYAQVFCRLAAVRGATYMLGTSPSLIEDAAGKLSVSIAVDAGANADDATALQDQQTVEVDALVLEHGQGFQHLCPESVAELRIARGIAILDAAIPGTEDAGTVLIVVPPNGTVGAARASVHVVALDPKTMVCPAPYHVVHLTVTCCDGLADDAAAQTLLQPVLKHLTASVVWQCYFALSLPDAGMMSGAAANNNNKVWRASQGDASLTLDQAISEARALFNAIAGDDVEFLQLQPLVSVGDPDADPLTSELDAELSKLDLVQSAGSGTMDADTS